MSSAATIRSNNSQPKTAKEVIAANVQALIEQLNAGHSDALTAYLNAMSRFHNYSFGNILEIARQRPDATRVAGFWKWKELGRSVKKGEKGSLFADVQGDQCLDGACYQSEVTLHIDRGLAENPQFVQIETAWRPLKEQRPGALPKNAYRVLDVPDNPDAEPPCPNTKMALIVFGRGAGKNVTICTDDECPVHDPTTAARIAREQATNPTPVMEPAPDEETEEEVQAQEASYEERRKEYEAEQERLAAERKAAFERQQEEYEAEVKRREEQQKARLATLEHIIEQAPASFNAAQLRVFVELLLNLSPYGLFEEVAEHFVGNDENNNKADDEILSEALADVILNVQSAVALNFVLPIGATSESVTVEAASAVINTTDASVSTVIDRKFVENIPLNGRSFQDLIQMTPGVVTQSPQTTAYVGGQGDFSVNGQRTESNYYTVDGVSAAGAGEATGYAQNANSGSIAASTALGTTQSILSVDALQEFRVSSSTYSAEYGRGPGGQFSFSTRSGTNGFHGAVFDYLRNDAVDANDWFNNHYGDPRTALRQNDFGGTLGGPVRFPHVYNGVGRSFFFVSYEGLRLVEPTPASIQYVPSLGVRSSSPSALEGIFNAFPLPTGPEVTTPCDGVTITCPANEAAGTPVPSGLSPFVKGYSLPAQIDATSLRLDQKLSEKLSAFLRVAYTPTSSQIRNLSQVSNSELGTISYTAGATNLWSSALSNEFRIGYVRSRSALVSSLDTFGGATPVNLRSAMGIPGSYPSSAPTPYIYISGVGSSALSWNDALTKFHQWNIVDTVSWLKGHHALRFGIDERHISSPLAPPDLVALAEFLSPQSMITNSVDFNFLQKNDSSVPTFNEFAAFAQDEWRIRPSLTLSFGLRWEVNPPPHGADGKDAYTVLGNINAPETLTLAPRGTPLWRTSWYNFAPRLGMAWTVHSHPGRETVLRAGGGVYFDTGNQLGTQGFSQLGFYAYQAYLGTPLPISPSQLDFSTAPTPPYTQSGVYAFPTHMQLPYTLQWNMSLEQALGKSQSVSFSYVASAGRRLLQTQLRNVASINPEFGNINYVVNGATSNYQSLQVRFQRSIPHGLHSLVTYGWSHSLDYGSNNAALPLTYGDSDFDVRHNLQGGVSWDLPEYRGKRLIGALLNDWSTDQRVMVRTAFPITLQGKVISDPVTGNRYYGNLNLVPGVPVYLYGSQYAGGKAINPAAFAYPSNAASKGTAPRNFVRGFGEGQWNTALRRDFPIHETLTAQFRVEAFNVLNHPNFGYVDPTLSDAQFGLATSMLNQSLGSMSALYQQGGPRSMQFALKLSF